MDARKYAVSYLNAGPRTEKQVRDYLRKKGCGREETEEAVKELKDYGYIDDENYCRMYFEYAFDRKRGIERIKRELREKGVSSEIIEMALESAEDVPDQY